MVYASDSPIHGIGTASAAAIDQWIAARGPAAAATFAPDHTYRPAPPIGQTIIAIATDAGVNSDLVAAQIAHESAFWQSAIVRDKNNPSGLGAENTDPSGTAYDKAITFATPEDGIRATVAHLVAYTKGDVPFARQYDPRFAAVKAAGWLGVAHVLSDLNGRWAYPGTTYGQQVAAAANNLLTFAATMGEPPMSNPYPWMHGLVDIRSQLPTSTAGNHGPQDRRAMSDKRGIVVHYSGPPNAYRDNPMKIMGIEAGYHVGKNWCAAGQPPCYGDGYMYHVAIDDLGTKYLCRDLESVLWHCGAWPQNAIALSVHVLIGGEQHATAAALAALTEVCDDWRAQTATPMSQVWGHQELMSTDCPGTLMREFVLPYRTHGEDKPVADGQWFSETQHHVGGAFWDYWNTHGGLAQFGYPLTDEVQEDGHAVQYFERAVLEWHPDNDDPYKVLLRRLGATAAAAGGYSGAGI